MDIQSEKNERRFIKLIFGGLTALLLIALLCWAAIKGFCYWQEGRLIRRASAYLSGGDYKAASLSVRRALQINAQNPDAIRVLAQIADRTGDPGATDLWRKLAESRPDDTESALALIRAALRTNDLKTAETTLQRLSDQAKQTAPYHAACGRVAQMRKDTIEAERHWALASELAPENTSYEFQLASIRLESTNESKRKSAVQVLEKLRTDPKQRAAATRTLLANAMAHHAGADRLRELASELQAYPEAMFNDRLLYLEVLRQIHDPAFSESLGKLEQDATIDPANLSNLFSWMSNNETAAEAIAFANTLPKDLVRKWPILPALATAYDKQKDWSGLEGLARNADWGNFAFLGHAYLSRALRGQDQKLSGEQEWALAQKEASQPQSVLLLARTAAIWGWKDEALELLWILAKNEDSKLEALQTLYQYYAKLSDTPGLYRTLRRLAEALPNDLTVQNNLAQVSLLLGTDSEHAKRIAAEIKEKEPSNEAYVSTYAFSLYCGGDVKGALQEMEQLSQNQLREPSISAYYGVLLAADRQTVKAREYLQRATETSLLPEEKALISKAESTLQ